MELTIWQSFVMFMWGEFKPLRYLAYTKRLEDGMAKRFAYKFAANSTMAEIEEFLKQKHKEE